MRLTAEQLVAIKRAGDVAKRHYADDRQEQYRFLEEVLPAIHPDFAPPRFDASALSAS